MKNDFEALTEVAVEFANKYIGECVPKRKIRKLGEEVAELCEAIGTGDEERAMEELGDVLFIVVHLASAYHTTPFQLLASTLEKVEKRLTNPNYKR